MARLARILSVMEGATATPVALGTPGTTVQLPSPERVVPSVLIAAQRQARALLEQAEQRAEQEYERRCAEFERAFQQREQIRALREIAEDNTALQRQADTLSRYGCLLAERLLGEQLRLAPSTILTLTQEVLREIRGAKNLTITASPGDLPHLLSVKAPLAEQFGAEIELLEEPQLGPGELIVESELGRTDARIQVRLTCLLEMLKQRSQS